MTATDLAAALIEDVPIGYWVKRADVLAALTAALDPALAERAGEVLEGVTPGPWTLCRLADQTPHSIQASYGCINGLSALFTLAHINAPDEAEVGMTDGAFDRETAEANARFIAWARNNVPALLAQNAALRAELDKWMERCGRERAFASSHRIRAEAAEAEVEKLRAAATWAMNHVSTLPMDEATQSEFMRHRAALTTEADNG